MFYGKSKRRLNKLVAIAAIALLMLGCQTLRAGSQSLVDKGLPQYLPAEAVAVIHDHAVDLEVAATPEQQALGLMYRADLGENRGMLFPFDPPRPAAFWMKNTLMALDIIFLRDQQVVTIHANVPPCKTPACPTYSSNGPIDQAIELEAGQAQRLGVEQGDRIQVEFQGSLGRPTPKKQPDS